MNAQGVIIIRIVIRTDASLQIGTGHVMRCLTLAITLRTYGAECEFVCREHEGNLISRIQEEGFKCTALATSPEINDVYDWAGSVPAHADWLGTSWRRDAQETIRALGAVAVDWLVVDHYALDKRWEKALRLHSDHIMVIDDLADRQHDCDLLLDQNYGSSAMRYNDLVSADCKQYHGPEYALLKSVYAERRAHMAARYGHLSRVLIFFGGDADPMNLTGTAITVFKSKELQDIQLDIVVGANNAHQQSIANLVAERGNVTIYRQLPDLAELMANADLAIGAAGSTTWERCCMGLPSILVVCALNQKIIGDAISQSGAGIVLYPTENLAAEIKKYVCDLRAKSSTYLEISNKSREICDGLGAFRISQELISR